MCARWSSKQEYFYLFEILLLASLVAADDGGRRRKKSLRSIQFVHLPGARPEQKKKVPPGASAAADHGSVPSKGLLGENQAVAIVVVETKGERRFGTSVLCSPCPGLCVRMGMKSLLGLSLANKNLEAKVLVSFLLSVLQGGGF